MRFALGLGDAVDQPLPLAAASNETFKRARIAHGSEDFSAVYEAVRPPTTPTNTAVLFDFDGTLGDTEVPAMNVAFWELVSVVISMPPSPSQIKQHDLQSQAICELICVHLHNLGSLSPRSDSLVTHRRARGIRRGEGWPGL